MKSKVLSLVKGNLVDRVCITLGLGLIIGFVSMIIYNCIVYGTECYFVV
jgi:hypothetical protein